MNTNTLMLKKDCKIITLLPLHYENTEKILTKEYPSKTLKPVQNIQAKKPSVDQEYKNLENFKSSSNIINNNPKIDPNNNTKNIDHILSGANSKKLVNTINEIVDVHPCIIKYLHPKYPNSARLLNIEGELHVIYDINVIGKIENIRILSSVPNGVFESNVKLAMRRWIYEKNKPKKNLIVVFKFSLND